MEAIDEEVVEAYPRLYLVGVILVVAAHLVVFWVDLGWTSFLITLAQ